jgi:ribosome-associated protein
MIQITNDLAIREDEVKIKFIRSSGPGGQNVNKVSTAVQLRFNASDSPTLPADIRARLRELAGTRMTEEGILIIEAHEYRSQEQNRQAAIERLVTLIKEAAKEPSVRQKTKPPLRSKERRLENKRHRSEIKRLRKTINDFD